MSGGYGFFLSSSWLLSSFSISSTSFNLDSRKIRNWWDRAKKGMANNLSLVLSSWGRFWQLDGGFLVSCSKQRIGIGIYDGRWGLYGEGFALIGGVRLSDFAPKGHSRFFAGCTLLLAASVISIQGAFSICLDHIWILKIGNQRIWKWYIDAIFKQVNTVLTVTPSHSISKLIAVSINDKRYLPKQGHNMCIKAVVESKDKRDRCLKYGARNK